MESFLSLSWRYCDEVWWHTRYYIHEASWKATLPFDSHLLRRWPCEYGASAPWDNGVPPECRATIADLTQIFQGPCKLSIGAYTLQLLSAERNKIVDTSNVITRNFFSKKMPSYAP